MVGRKNAQAPADQWLHRTRPHISPGFIAGKEPRRSPMGHCRFARKFSRRAGALVRPDEQVRAWTTDRRRPWEDQQAARRHGPEAASVHRCLDDRRIEKGQRQHHPIERSVRFSRSASPDTSATVPATSSSSQRRAKAIPLSSRACSSTRIGRMGPSDLSGRMMSRRRVEDGFRQSTRMTSDAASAASFFRRISI